jgi:putative (di)nucleoside polyphosphate hydrolase
MGDKKSMTYRRAVGMLLFNRDGLVWVGRRVPKWEGDGSQLLWQMPQGGIDKGESPQDAALRELDEEIGTSRVEILAETKQWLSYDLPAEALGVAFKGKYRGQTLKWFAMRFVGNDSDIDISERGGHKVEFDDWRWVALDQLPALAVPFKRAVYEAVVEEFAGLA